MVAAPALMVSGDSAKKSGYDLRPPRARELGASLK
jgi:hypothetical protein